MKVYMHTLSKAEPTQDLIELNRRWKIRMRFSDFGVMLADGDFVKECIMQFRWKEEFIDFRFIDPKLGNKNVIVRVKMDDPDETIIEKFTQAEELVEKNKNENDAASEDNRNTTTKVQPTKHSKKAN